MFYAVPRSWVIFTTKRKLDLFSLGQEVWTYSVLGDRIYEMKKVPESGWQGIKTGRSFLPYFDPWWTQHQPRIKPIKPLGQCWPPPPYHRLLRSAGATEGLLFLRDRSPSPDTRSVRYELVVFRSVLLLLTQLGSNIQINKKLPLHSAMEIYVCPFSEMSLHQK